MAIAQKFSDIKDGFEVRPGIILLNTPSYHDGQWRCLANVHGMLAVISLKIGVRPDLEEN